MISEMSTFQMRHQTFKRSLSESDLTRPDCGIGSTNKPIENGFRGPRFATRSLSNLSLSTEASCTPPPLPPRPPRATVNDLPVERARYESKKRKTVKWMTLSAIWGLRHRTSNAGGETEGSERENHMPKVPNDFVKDSMWKKRLSRFMKADGEAHMMSGALLDEAVD